MSLKIKVAYLQYQSFFCWFCHWHRRIASKQQLLRDTGWQIAVIRSWENRGKKEKRICFDLKASCFYCNSPEKPNHSASKPCINPFYIDVKLIPKLNRPNVKQMFSDVNRKWAGFFLETVRDHWGVKLYGGEVNPILNISLVWCQFCWVKLS